MASPCRAPPFLGSKGKGSESSTTMADSIDRPNSLPKPQGILRLPEANEFSPGQIDLRRVLELVNVNRGGKVAIVEAIRREYFSESARRHRDPQRRLRQQRTRASNVLIGMKGYALFDADRNALTLVGDTLLRLPDDDKLYEEFGRHILRNCHGVEVLQAMRNLQARGIAVTKGTLAAELRRIGFKLPRATTHHTKLLQWLRMAKVLEPGNKIVGNAVARMIGAAPETLEEWSYLTPDQIAFLRTLHALAQAHGTDAIASKIVVDLSEREHGPLFKEDQLRAQVFRPLAQMGWIVLGSVGPGRGGKSGTVAATPKLLAMSAELMGVTYTDGIPPDLRHQLNMSIDEIYRDLQSTDTGVKGTALELLALRVAIDLGLTPVGLRVRGAVTAGAEVDLIAESAHFHFTRWLFQCKNTPTVVVGDLAKEVGLASLVSAHVIVLVTTGRFVETVEEYAREVAETTHLQVVPIDGRLLDEYRIHGPRALHDFLRVRAGETLRIKQVRSRRASRA